MKTSRLHTRRSSENVATSSLAEPSIVEMTAMECVFCEELKMGTEIIDALETVVALPDRYPVSKGHALIVPKRHVEQIFDLSDREAFHAWRLLALLRDRLRQLDPTIVGFNIGANEGEAAGQTIPHAHIHLIPRRAGDTRDPRGGVRGVIPDKMKYQMMVVRDS